MSPSIYPDDTVDMRAEGSFVGATREQGDAAGRRERPEEALLGGESTVLSFQKPPRAWPLERVQQGAFDGRLRSHAHLSRCVVSS